MIKKFSIVPDMIKAKGMQFFDETGIEKTSEICPSLKGKPEIPEFQPPFIIIDTFPKKTTRPIQIVNVEIDELKKLGFIICVLKTVGEFRSGQKVTYKLAHKSNPIYNSRIIGYIPTNHTVQKDVNNKKIRMQGKNAGRFGFSKWIDISSESPTEIINRNITPVKKKAFGRHL